jgi:hypothetical protein
MHQDFWGRWQLDYLSQMLQRQKWHHQRANVKVDDLVIIQHDHLPPTQWLLGRIIEVHPGGDGLVRSVTIRHATGELRRPVQKICVLPVDKEPSEPQTEAWGDAESCTSVETT